MNDENCTEHQREAGALASAVALTLFIAACAVWLAVLQ